MKIKITPCRTLEITTEDIAELIFLEDVLGLKNDGDTITCKRVNAANLCGLAYLEIKKEAKP